MIDQENHQREIVIQMAYKTTMENKQAGEAYPQKQQDMATDKPSVAQNEPMISKSVLMEKRNIKTSEQFFCFCCFRNH
ncbi:MAG: hypothetical protein N2115_00700 [bacterium]|nr:hypothetical protein [bacterium]